MTKVMKVALPGYNALTDTDPDHFSLYVDQVTDNVLIKEKARGIGSVDFAGEAEISHNLTYIPFYLVYTEISANRYRLSNSYNPVGSGWRVFADTTKLYIDNNYSADFTDYRYYIFYDNMS
jgi:hypothetical protein